MIKSPFCGAYKIIILGHNHLCLTQKINFNFYELRLPDDDPVYTLKKVMEDLNILWRKYVYNKNQFYI